MPTVAMPIPIPIRTFTGTAPRVPMRQMPTLTSHASG